MTAPIALTIYLEPGVADLLAQIAEDGQTTREALAAEAVTKMVSWVISGIEGDVDPEEERLMGQLAFIQDTLDEFEG